LLLPYFGEYTWFLLSKDGYEKLMREIENQIDDADEDAKQKAWNILHAIKGHYNAVIVETIAYELQMAGSKQSVATWQKQNGIN
jgi:hypothetical protein